MATEDEDPREESIKVCCRFRPQLQIEQNHSGKICVEIPDDNTTVYMTGTDQSFVFDRVFEPDAPQKEVYDYAAKPIISGVLKGFNGTVFAYGQTSSGKTHTMEGPDIEDSTHQGVIPRMVWSIFEGIYHAEEHIEFLVKVSIVEIYNERIRDLLDPKKDNLKIHEDKARGVFIGEVTETYVGCEQEIFELMRNGQINRAMAVTNMNEHSSRSHLVFTLTIEQKDLHDRSVKVGKLHLVDLAGSEKVAKTGASGDRLDEAKNINRSLSALGNVINALTDKKCTHVPYRDSKLTRVLQESLGGNARTSLIITCSPSNFNEQETTSTLRFGQRAKLIKNVVKINHERSAEELKLLLEKRDQTVAELRRKLSTFEQLLRRSGDGEAQQESGSPALLSVQELLVQMQDARDQLQERSEQVAELAREREDLLAALALKEQQIQQLASQSALAHVDSRPGGEWTDVERLRRENIALTHEEEPKDLDGFSSSSTVKRSAPLDPLRQAGAPPAGAPRSGGDDRWADPAKRKASPTDQKLEQLTVLYHQLVKQNSSLKTEKCADDQKIHRQDQKIAQLEKSLREVNHKYENLLSHSAKVMEGKRAGFMGGNNQMAAMHDFDEDFAGADQMRRGNIVRPVRGGERGE